ncbi:MAG: HAD family hydrolase [Acidobacteriaceae bacterium]
MRDETRNPAQALLIDADDTLWENNIYFERAIEAFIGYLNHEKYGPHEVREILYAIEREHIPEHGYGVACFSRSLMNCFERLSDPPVTAGQRERVADLAHSIARHEIELRPGVAETLPDLASRHRLLLMTKGEEEAQREKVLRSGLERYFDAIEVVAEKDCAAYLAVCGKHGLVPDGTWMVGNSPRSDINPALAAGLHAAYIHHPGTWALEHGPLGPAPQGQRLLELETFADLRLYF